MKKRLIILKFESSEDFCRYYETIQQKRLFLPSRSAIATGTPLVISLIIPMVNRLFSLEGSAEIHTDLVTAGIQVNLDESFDDFMYELDTELSAHDEYARKLNCAPFFETPISETDDGELTLDLDYGKRIGVGGNLETSDPEPTTEPSEPALPETEKKQKYSAESADDEPSDTAKAPASFEWIREVVSHEEYEIEADAPPEDHGQAVHDKKDLTAEERQRVEPVGQFTMNFTKAVLRSGYYDPDHPGAVSAKQGLYEEFQKVLFDTRELMITKEETREHVDFMITGILDLPVTVRTVVGQGVAELFAPKLHEYFEKKELISLAIKKEITNEHFEKFIDIMSDPKVDRSEERTPGQILTNALVEQEISEISAIFFDDRLNLEKDLPWRVEMAMHRLAKDLKLLPMFKGTESDIVSQIKEQSIQDIIRPLKHPKLLNDFLVNCYIIAQHIENMEPREIEQIIVDAFPIDMLLPTSNYTFEELDRLNAMKLEYPDSSIVDRRLKGIKRILKMVARRVVIEKAKGGQNFLAHLYDNQILTFEELPADAQYVINTREMARDVKNHFTSYSQAMRSADDVDDLVVFLKCFRRIMPLLIEEKDWKLIVDISQVIEKSADRFPHPKNKSIDALAAETVYLKVDKNKDASVADKNETVQSALDYVFMDQTHTLALAYETVAPEERKNLTPIFDCLGYLGVETLGRILADTQDRQLRGHIVNWLIQKKAAARKWAHRILNEPNRMWYLYRNAMLILREVSNDPADADSIRPFLDDANSRLRLEALNVISSLKPGDLEALIIASIGDSDSRINWRAVKALGELPSISSSSIQEILGRLTLEPQDPDNASGHFRHVSLLISAINGLHQIPMRGRIESDIIRLGEQIAFKDKKWRQFLKRAVGAEDASVILKAAIPLLGRIGGSDAQVFLKKLLKSRPDLSSAINEALESIQNRA
ncbi:MAG TPA: HEAT repeat domain-containing protein [Desulfosalsimonadaceae bacterium]|nr:HEAT repeat domain-containing protein [Desulfosalsimonadaceae bacterium]